MKMQSNLSYNNKNMKYNQVKSVSITLKNKEKYKIFLIPNKTSKHKEINTNRASQLNKANKQNSWPELSRNSVNKSYDMKKRGFLTKLNIKNASKNPVFKNKINVNVMQDTDRLRHPFSSVGYKIYRCQFNTQEESCCCSCNSDAMFEVMKSLYDCYKKKNCDHCNCILCGHLPREERKLGELRKSGIEITPEVLEAKDRQKKKLKKLKDAGFLTPLEGKTPEKKEEIVRELAKAGIPIPEGKSKSEKEMIMKVKTELGLPKEPKTAAEREKLRKATEAGLITPLEGKTTDQKEKILKQQLELGVPLPEGRTPSEKVLIEKVKTAAGVSRKKVPSEKMKKAKEKGLLTPLQGKTKKQKEKILKGFAKKGLPLPEAKSESEKQLIDKVRAEVGLPPEPKTFSVKEKYIKADAAGFITPLEGKSPSQKERILRGQAEMGLQLPEGRTTSEKSIIAKIKATSRPISELKVPSEKLRKAKAAGFLTPLEGKKPEQKEKILKGLAMHGVPLPMPKTASEKKLMDKVRADVGLPPAPETASAKAKYNEAVAAGFITPLEGKTVPQKEKILRKQAKMGLPLPEGRTASENALIAKVKATARPSPEVIVPSEKLKKAKAAGFLTPLEGKKLEQKEKILRGLAMQGIPLPVAKTSSEKKLMDKVRAEVGLPPEPKTSSAKVKYEKAIAAGVITPLEGKTALQKEKILRNQAELGLPLPEGRTPSEKALVSKIKETVRPTSAIKLPPEKIRKAKAAGLLTPLEGKKPEQKEKILRGLAMQGIPLPVAKTSSEKKIMDKVRAEVGLPPEPKTSSAKVKYDKAIAAGVITPLEGKTAPQKEKILKKQAEIGLLLPEGRTDSEKALISKIKATVRPIPEVKLPSEKIRKAKAAGLFTPLEGKKPEQKEKILRGLAMQGLPLPVAKTASEKKILDKVRAEVGLPPEPKISSAKVKYDMAIAAGVITPLEGKTPPQKEKILRKQAEMGLPLPEGRTASEKDLISKVKETVRPISAIKLPSEKIRKAKAAGLLTPLEGKKPEQKEKILRELAMQGIPLPVAKNASEKKIMDKVRAEVGLPPEPKTSSAKVKYDKAIAAGVITPLEGKTPPQKEKILKKQAELGLPLPEGRTPSEKALVSKIKETIRPTSAIKLPSEKIRKAKAAGLLTPLEGKKPEQKEKILRGLAMQGIPLPLAKTSSEKKIMDKVRAEVGLPPEPKTSSAKVKYDKAIAAGVITPLEGKTPPQKEKILKKQAELGLPLPEGRTPSEKALVSKIKETIRPTSAIKLPSEKIRKAKAAGLLTPLEGKKPEQKEKIIRGLAMQGIPLPVAKTTSEKKIMDKVRAEVGLPPEPMTSSAKVKYDKAIAAGVITPLEGKTPPQKEKILKKQAELGLPLPEGRTPSEKALVSKIKETIRPTSAIKLPSEKIRKAKAAGLFTPLEGKKPEQKEKILRGLAMQGIPLPVAKTSSEKKIMDKVRAEVGLPPEPKTSSAKVKYDKAIAAGVITPLEGKTPSQKEKILKNQAELGLPLPEGRTPSEKALVSKIKETIRPTSAIKLPSEKIRKAKAAGLFTPLEGKKPEQKEKILRGLAMQGIPLPVAKTSSEKKIMDKVRAEVGLPPEPKTSSAKVKYDKAIAAGVITPLEGKTPPQKEKILKKQAELGLPLPEGRTPSEKALVSKIKETIRPTSAIKLPSEKIRKAKAAGLLTPLGGKKPEEKEKILRGLAMQGIPLPLAKTSSEKKIMDKVRTEVGLPPEPKTSSARVKYDKAIAAGVITPLEGKTSPQKEKILKKQAELGLPLPEGRTASEKALISKIKATVQPTPEVKLPSEKIRKAKAAGLLTPLEGKKPEQKEKILRGLAMQGIPLPVAKTASEKKIMDKVRAEVGLPPEPKISSAKVKYDKAIAAGVITPLEGKTPPQKEKILRKQAEMGLPLPEGRTASEKALIAKVKATVRPPSELAIVTEKIRKAKAAGLITPLTGKSPEQKEKILKGLAMQGVPLPEIKTASEKKIAEKVRAELGLPPEPKTAAEREKLQQAQAAGIIIPLEGKSRSEKEKIIKAQADIGLQLPQGRTASEKAIIKKVQASVAKEKEYKKSPEKLKKLEEKSAKVMKESKGHSDECICGILTPESDKIKIKDMFRPTPSEKFRAAQAAGILTPLEGKSPSRKEKILKNIARHGLLLPEGKSPSEVKLIDKVRAEVGLPPEPGTPFLKEKYRKAQAAGIITPLEGKSPEEKKKILIGLAKAGIPLPEPKSVSEKNFIANVREEIGLPPEPKTASLRERMKNAQAAGIVTPLEGKTAAQKENILKRMHDAGIPLPEGRTASEKTLVRRIKAGLVEEKIPSEKLKAAKAAGLLTPLEGKTPAEKEKIIKSLIKEGLPVPVPKTASDKAIIDKVKTEVKYKPKLTPSQKMKQAKAAGLLTPLEGKTVDQKIKILRGLAKTGVPLPEPKSPSEKDLVQQVRKEVGLPPEPKTSSQRQNLLKAQAAGIITPLEGKTTTQKKAILKRMHDAGITLPEGRTSSEKSLVRQVKAEFLAPSKSVIQSEKFKAAKAAGLLTPLEGKSPAQKEKILKGLAKSGLPLPEGKTPSEKELNRKVRTELGLPPEPKSSDEKIKMRKAQEAGLVTPLEGKTEPQKEMILRELIEAGVPLPSARTKSEKALIKKVQKEAKAKPLPPEKLKKLDRKTIKMMKEGKGPSNECICRILTPEPERNVLMKKIPISEKIRRAEAAGLFTPLEGKKPEQKAKILKGLAMHGVPLPEAKTASEKNLIEKVRVELGLPPEPKTSSAKIKYDEAIAAGIITPLEGKTIPQKEKILRQQAEMGLALPEARTASEKAIISKVKATVQPIPKVKLPSEKLRQAKAAGLLTPLKGKKPEHKEKILRGLAMKGIPLPVAKTASEKKIMDKVIAEIGLPPVPTTSSAKIKYDKAIVAGILTPLEGKSTPQKEEILKKQAEMGLPLPEGRTASEKALISKIKKTVRPTSEIKLPSEKIRKAKAAGLLTPLEGKKPDQKETILKGLALQGLPLPEARTSSEKKIMDKVRAEVGLPPEPKSASEKNKYNKAIAAGIITPLEGKTAPQKEKTLRQQAKMGLPLPEGRTASEKALIQKVTSTSRPPSEVKVPSEKLRKAKDAGLLTPLEGKEPKQKEKILKGLAIHGIPLPVPKTASEKKIMDKIRAEVGLPPEPKTASEKLRYDNAVATGIITPLEGKTAPEKEKILRQQAELGLPLPVGRTISEKDIIDKVKKTVQPISEMKLPSEKLRKAREAGLLTPLEGKKPEQKEKILKDLAMQGLPLPEAKTASEKKIMDKVRADVGLPPEPKTASEKLKYNKAIAAGIITPLEGKTSPQKEKILRQQAEMGLPLPEGRTDSEKALLQKINAKSLPPPEVKIPSVKLRKAKAAGLLTPLEGKKPEEKEKILKGLAMHGIPLPLPKTASEKKIMDNIRAEVGLPPEPKSPSDIVNYNKAIAAGVITPLEGKTAPQKEKILRQQAEMGLPLPQGRTASEKDLISKVKATARTQPLVKAPSEKLREAKAAGLLTPLEGKKPEQKAKILKGLAMHGLPLPIAKTASERKILDKIRAEVGLPPEPKTSLARIKYDNAIKAGIITPLEGKTAAQKEKILQKQAEMGLPLPEGRTKSEKALISKIKATTPPIPEVKVPSEKMRKAKALGLLTPLEGKKPEQKEKILKGLAMHGVPLPIAKTASEKKILDKVRAEVGLPPEPKSPSAKAKYDKALAAGIITPLEGKTTPQKEKIIRQQLEMGLPLPEGRSTSEKALIAKIKAKTLVPSEISIPSEKIRKGKAAGILTPLEGKPTEKKKKILQEMAETGLPLPEGKTASEKSLIRKIKTEYGIPPKAKTPSEKEILKKAKAEGILTPLKGKTATQKEKILKGLAEAGLPMPEGRTKSEKALVQKIRKAAGLPPEPTPSEKKGKIKTKTKKVGITPSKKVGKAGIVEEFEDIIKTTTCDRGCGCDKKKIRFKHSYVKIRVTSPDISSLCPCPEECVPGVKGGVFTDNEGIKVTVGRITGFTPFLSKGPSRSVKLQTSWTDDYGNTKKFNESSLIVMSTTSEASVSTEAALDYLFINDNRASVSSLESSFIARTYSSLTFSSRSCSEFESDSFSIISIYSNDATISIDWSDNNYAQYLCKKSEDAFQNDYLDSHNLYTGRGSRDYYCIYECSSDDSKEEYVVSYTSFFDLSEKHFCCDFFVNQASQSRKLERNSKSSCKARSSSDYFYIYECSSDDFYNGIYEDYSSIFDNTVKQLNCKLFTYRSSKSRILEKNIYGNLKKLYQDKITKDEPLIIIDDSTSDNKIDDIINQLILRKSITNLSSLILIVPDTDDSLFDCYSDSFASNICIRNSYISTWKTSNISSNNSEQTRVNFEAQGLKIYAKGKKEYLESRSALNPTKNSETSKYIIKRRPKITKKCKSQCRTYSTDTTQDRPCCCSLSDQKIYSKTGSSQSAANIFSELVSPIVLKEAIAQGLNQEAYFNASDKNASQACAVASQKVNQHQLTSVELFKVASYNGQTDCHKCPENLFQTDRLNPKCDSYKKKEPYVFPEPCVKPPENKKSVSTSLIQGKQQLKFNMSCDSCGLAKTTMDGKNRPELNDTDVCPCLRHKPPMINLNSNEHTRIKSVGCQCCVCSDAETETEMKYIGKKTKKKFGNRKREAHTCECPKEQFSSIQEDADVEEFEWIDERRLRKMRSDLTQTTSGFKINKKRKQNINEEMSFEDALKYFEEHPLYDNNIDDKKCSCQDEPAKQPNIKNKSECECPYEIANFSESEHLSEAHEPFKGIKFRIDGKGSSSKGLTGICCFDLLEDNNFNNNNTSKI